MKFTLFFFLFFKLSGLSLTRAGSDGIGKVLGCGQHRHARQRAIHQGLIR
ncbi:hypothetical protein [Undibacterium sp.]|nr:hypothetical protein [Undibacterium sp.]HTD05178.1 hypothetical protein [Undibacterium sp.]